MIFSTSSTSPPAADRAAEHFPDDLAQQSAYREGTLDLVLDTYARLRGGAPLAGGTGG